MKIEEDEFFGRPDDVNDLITPVGVAGFVKSLNLPVKVRDYQYQAIYECLIQQTTPIVANCQWEILDDLCISEIPY